MRTIIGLAVALAGLAFGAPSFAKEKPISQAILNFTDNYATAIGLASACPSWRLDRAKAGIALAASGLADDAYETPGPLHDRFMAAGTKAKSLNRDTACDAAKMLFGPDGSAAPGFMEQQ